MPSRSRKRAKGKERRAKAKASFSNLILHDESKCNHCLTIPTDDICVQFVQQFEYELNIVYVSLTKSDTRFGKFLFLLALF